MSALLAEREQEVIDRVVDLADAHAAALAGALPAVVSDEQLREVIAGTLLMFLVESLVRVRDE